MGEGAISPRARSLERHLRPRLHLQSATALRLSVTDPLADFLFKRQGNCEYFASSMAVMLRLRAYPHGSMNGFAGGTYNPISDLYMIRASDAHSWVEAYIRAGLEDVRSHALRATAGFNFSHDHRRILSRRRRYVLAGVGTELRSCTPVRFGATIELGIARLVLALASGECAPARRSNRDTANHLATAPRSSCIVAVVLLIAFGRSWFESLRSDWLVRRIHPNRAKPADAAILYEHMLRIMKKRGYQKPAWFTPREFAATVRKDAVDEFTECYNSLRFGGDPAAAERMKENSAGTFLGD